MKRVRNALRVATDLERTFAAVCTNDRYADKPTLLCICSISASPVSIENAKKATSLVFKALSQTETHAALQHKFTSTVDITS